jgi:hypothetical membrane protein
MSETSNRPPAMAMPPVTETDRARPAPPRVAALAWAGLAGPAVFVLAVIIQQAYRGHGYVPTRQEISELTAGGAGWAQQLTFVVFGVSIITFAAGLHRGVATTRWGILGPGLLAIDGLQLVVAGVFPLRLNDSGMVYDPIGVHSANGTVFFVGLGVPLIVLSLRLHRDPRWRRLDRYVFGTGIALVAAVALVVVLVRPAGAVLHPWLGTAQRLIVVVWLACVAAMALRLRRIATDQPGSQPDTPPWVKWFGIALAVVVGLIAAMMFFGGNHGPGMHGPGMHTHNGLAGIDAVATDGGR